MFEVDSPVRDISYQYKNTFVNINIMSAFKGDLLANKTHTFDCECVAFKGNFMIDIIWISRIITHRWIQSEYINSKSAFNHSITRRL